MSSARRIPADDSASSRAHSDGPAERKEKKRQGREKDPKRTGSDRTGRAGSFAKRDAAKDVTGKSGMPPSRTQRSRQASPTPSPQNKSSRHVGYSPDPAAAAKAVGAKGVRPDKDRKTRDVASASGKGSLRKASEKDRPNITKSAKSAKSAKRVNRQPAPSVPSEEASRVQLGQKRPEKPRQKPPTPLRQRLPDEALSRNVQDTARSGSKISGKQSGQGPKERSKQSAFQSEGKAASPQVAGRSSPQSAASAVKKAVAKDGRKASRFARGRPAQASDRKTKGGGRRAEGGGRKTPAAQGRIFPLDTPPVSSPTSRSAANGFPEDGQRRKSEDGQRRKSEDGQRRKSEDGQRRKRKASFSSGAEATAPRSGTRSGTRSGRTRASAKQRASPNTPLRRGQKKSRSRGTVAAEKEGVSSVAFLAKARRRKTGDHQEKDVRFSQGYVPRSGRRLGFGEMDGPPSGWVGRRIEETRDITLDFGNTVMQKLHRKPVGTRVLDRETQERMLTKRLGVFLLLLILLFGLIVARLVQLQGVTPDEWQGRGRSQWLRRVEVPAGRGSVMDRNGKHLATSVNRPNVVLNPQQINDPDKTAKSLSEVIPNLSVDKLARSIRDSSKFYLLVARGVAPEVAEAVVDLDIPGVSLRDESVRRYPSGPLAAQVLGFVNRENIGKAGIEQAFNEELTGTAGRWLAEADPNGRLIPNGIKEWTPSRSGKDVKLTLDASIQFETEQVLREAVAAHGAEGGLAVIMDAQTGDILAYAADPTFDPHSPGESAPQTWTNGGVGYTFEPGSIGKAIIVAAALEEKLVTPNQIFEVPDKIRVYKETFTDSPRHDDVFWDVSEIFARSSNVGIIQIADLLGGQRLHDWMQRFGYGQKIGVRLPGEAGGKLRSPEEWDGVTVASAAIGYAFTLTPLQILQAYSVFANDGVMVQPRIVLSTGSQDRDEVLLERPDPVRVVSPETAAQMKDMLELVVTRGTGGQSIVPGYTVGGKTGTVRKVIDGTYASVYRSSFVGMAPLDNPRLIGLVVLDAPQPVYSGGRTAAPTFAKMANLALVGLSVPPSVVGQKRDSYAPVLKTTASSVFADRPALRPVPPRAKPSQKGEKSR